MFPSIRARVVLGLQVLSRATLVLLSRAGWSPGRLVDIRAAKGRLSAAGYVVSPAAAEFLRSFGRLSVVRPTPLGDDIVSFDAERKLLSFRSRSADAYSPLSGRPVTLSFFFSR